MNHKIWESPHTTFHNLLEMLVDNNKDNRFTIHLRPSQRKLKLFCASVSSNNADIEILEKYADGELELQQSRKYCKKNRSVRTVLECYEICRGIIINFTRELGDKKNLSDNLRDIVNEEYVRLYNNPKCGIWQTSNFFSGEVVSPDVINNKNVIAVAESIYATKAFNDMFILADALEEAGCNEEKIISHCRSNKNHYRGCWVLDLILNKQ